MFTACVHASFSKVMRHAVFVSVMTLAGCAAVDHSPTLTYPPAIASQGGVAGPKNKQIILSPFLDQRGDKSNVGTVRSTFGLRTTEVVPANDVLEWVTSAVKAELENSGYVVTLGSTDKDTLPGASATVSGVILGVSCNASDSAKVALIGKIKRAGREVMNKNYAADGSARSPWTSAAQSCAHSLTVALAASVKRFVADVDGILGG